MAIAPSCKEPFLHLPETALFVSHQGDVSGRATFTRDYVFTQKWILQGRAETNFAVQRVERFGLGRGLNDIDLRLRHEMRREFALTLACHGIGSSSALLILSGRKETIRAEFDFWQG